MASIEVFLDLVKIKPPGGHYLINPSVIAQFVPPAGTDLRPVVVKVHGVTDETYELNPENRNRVEISFPKKSGRHFVHPHQLTYPIPAATEDK